MCMVNDDGTSTTQEAHQDVFAAARWFGSLGNSSARAVSATEVEWQCNTWGSGRGRGDWLDVAVFALMIQRFDLDASRNYDGRDELLVTVPLERVAEIVTLIRLLGENPEEWPWVWDEDEDGEPVDQVAIAAQALNLPAQTLAADDDWLEVLRLL